MSFKIENHVLIRGKNKYSSKGNFISIDGKPTTQNELTSFYKDKRLFLSVINPMYFLNKKPAEQKELVDKYLSDVKPKVIFDMQEKQMQDKKAVSQEDRRLLCLFGHEQLPSLVREDAQRSF